MSKKIKLSEVESSHRQCPTIEGRYLLDLVSRMGKALEPYVISHGPESEASCPWCKEARALLKELEL